MSALPPVLLSSAPRRHLTASRRGFTLLELLVVIAIVAVLAGIAFPILQKVRAKGDQTKCASQLKQIGVAIMAYTQDNDQNLPGPVYNGQYGFFNNDKGYGAMMTWIYPYLGFSNVDSKFQRSDVFICPSFRKQIPMDNLNLTPRPYIVTGSVLVGSNHETTPLFGDAHAGTVRPPFKLNMVRNFATTSIIADLDGQLVGGSYANNPTTCPVSPIHGATRNWLFLDGHVEVSSQNLFNLDS